MGENVTGKLKIPQGSSMLMICIKSRGPGNASVQKLLFQNAQTTVKNTACNHYCGFINIR